MSILYDDACALFDGGWRSSDRDQLVDEYGFTDDEVDLVVHFLQELENDEIAVEEI